VKSGPSESHSSRPSAKAQALFDKGREAASKNNTDYAIDMFTQALKIEPENITYREHLRKVMRARFANDPAKVGWVAAGKARTARLSVGLSKSRGKWVDVLEQCEEVFKHNPWDVAAARDGAEASEQLGLLHLAKWYLESVVPQAGDDVGFLKHIGRIYERHEDWERAIACWEKVRRLAPGDEEAMRKAKDLSASETITRSGLDSALHRVSEGRSGPERPADNPELEELKRQKLSPEEQLRKEIAEEPQRIGSYLQLSDMLRRASRLDEAEKVLAAGIAANPGDNLLLEAHADVQIARLQRAIALFQRKVQENPADVVSQDKLAQFKAKLPEYELREYRRRVERRPDDLELRFALGERLRNAGQVDAAIAEFQLSRNGSSPAIKVRSLYQLGRCFEAKNLPKLAERNYQEALKLADPSDQKLLNELHYRLGRSAEAHGDLRAAEEHYNEVAANDYGFEDVAARLENLNRRGGS
jgi:tetratricopeptide (TPR) repeat protein